MSRDAEPTTSCFPGRICLLGEHCDWAGGASLAVPLPLTVHVTARGRSSGVTIDSVLDGTECRGSWPCEGLVDRDAGPLRFVGAALDVLYSTGLRVPPTALVSRSDLPTGRGFSSSAAFTLAILDVLTRRAGEAMSAERLAALALATERDRLGIPCGLLDPLACAAGAPVLIEWSRELPHGYRVEAVTPRRSLNLVVGSFRQPRDTRRILQALNDDFARPASATREALTAFALAARRGAGALAAGDSASLGQAMDSAQAVYESRLETRIPELAAPQLRGACAWFRHHGALGSKFSGAGGDGSVVALYPDSERAREALSGFRESFEVDAWCVSIPGTDLTPLEGVV